MAINGKYGVYLTLKECEELENDIKKLMKTKYNFEGEILFHSDFLEVKTKISYKLEVV